MECSLELELSGHLDWRKVGLVERAASKLELEKSVVVHKQDWEDQIVEEEGRSWLEMYLLVDNCLEMEQNLVDHPVRNQIEESVVGHMEAAHQLEPHKIHFAVDNSSVVDSGLKQELDSLEFLDEAVAACRIQFDQFVKLEYID